LLKPTKLFENKSIHFQMWFIEIFVIMMMSDNYPITQIKISIFLGTWIKKNSTGQEFKLNRELGIVILNLFNDVSYYRNPYCTSLYR